MALVKLSTKLVGSTVKLNENGSPVEFIVVHQDNPDSSKYVGFEGGTVVLRKEISSLVDFHFTDDNFYPDSDIQHRLNNNYINQLDTDIKAAVKQVKIPYGYESGYQSSSVSSGENGLSCKVFLLSMKEVGLSDSDASTEGTTLDYFTSGGYFRRIANYNGSPDWWWLRTPFCGYDNANVDQIWCINEHGGYDYSGYSSRHGMRPAFVLDGELSVSDDGTVTTNQPPTAPGSINATNVVGGQDATITITAATDPDGTVESYVYERSVDDSSHWDVIATTSALSTTDTISSEWGTVAYRAKAVDDDGASGPYVTSEQYDVNVGWVLIGGPSTAMGQQIKPFTLSANIGVSGQTGVTGIAVTGYLDGKKVLDTTINQNDNAEIYVDTRILASGQHTIQMTAEKTDLLPANKAWQFAIPFNALPDGGRAEQLRDDQGNPIFPRTTSQQVIGKHGVSIQNDIDALEKSFRGLTGHLEQVDAVYLGSAGAQTELPRESGVHYCFGVYSAAGSTNFTMVLIPADSNTSGTIDGGVTVTPSADKFTATLSGSNAAIVQYFKFVVDAEAEVVSNPSALFTALDQPHVLSASGGSSSSVTDQTEALETIIADNANHNYYVLTGTDGTKYYIAAQDVIQPSTGSFTGPVYQDDQGTTLYAGRTLTMVDTSNVAALFQPLAATVYDVTTQGTSVSAGSNINETLLAMIEAQPTWHRYAIPGSGGETYYVLSEAVISPDAMNAPDVYYCTDGSTYYTGGELSFFHVGDVGDIMTFAGIPWIIVHKTATEAYLCSQHLQGFTKWNELQIKCVAWNDLYLDDSHREILKQVTAGETNGYVFVGTSAQYNTGWSYFNSEYRRVCDNFAYWLSTSTDGGGRYVDSDGNMNAYGGNHENRGFRPSICIDLTKL